MKYEFLHLVVRNWLLGKVGLGEGFGIPWTTFCALVKEQKFQGNQIVGEI